MLMKKLTKDVYMEVLFFAFVLGIWLLWAFILPLNEGPDENMRLQIAQFILKYGKLPTGDQKEIMDYTWGFTYGHDPDLSNTAINSMLIRGADRNPAFTYPNKIWGFGTLNLSQSFLRNQD